MCSRTLSGDSLSTATSHNNPTETNIVLLGTGTPNADPARSGPSVAIVVGQTPYVVDFGPGVVRRAAAAHEAGLTGLDVPRLNRAFVTHLHSDHTAGYPDLILTPWVLGREDRLEVFGPPGIGAMTEHVLAAYRADIDERLNGLEPANSTGYDVSASEIAPGIVYRDRYVTVEVPHARPDDRRLWRHGPGRELRRGSPRL
jgi:ribonuclease BN (tRNA processing enzyme)